MTIEESAEDFLAAVERIASSLTGIQYELQLIRAMMQQDLATEQEANHADD